MDKQVDNKIIGKITEASSFSKEMLNRSIGAYSKKDIKEANENIELLKKLDTLCDEAKTLALKKEPIIALSIGYIVDSIGRIGEYAEDISETVINHLVGVKEEKK